MRCFFHPFIACKKQNYSCFFQTVKFSDPIYSTLSHCFEIYAYLNLFLYVLTSLCYCLVTGWFNYCLFCFFHFLSFVYLCFWNIHNHFIFHCRISLEFGLWFVSIICIAYYLKSSSYDEIEKRNKRLKRARWGLPHFSSGEGASIINNLNLKFGRS